MDGMNIIDTKTTRNVAPDAFGQGEGSMTHMDAVRARHVDPDYMPGAERRTAAIWARANKKNMNAYKNALQAERSSPKRFLWLKLITDELAKATTGVVPCAAGCDACCHMTTLISRKEAEAIAKATGRTMATVSESVYTQADEIDLEKYTGVPCPFLQGGQCGVYEQRPFACRVHYSVDRDSLLCKIVPGEVVTAPSPDTTQFQMLHALAHPNPLKLDIADIREFFPV